VSPLIDPTLLLNVFQSVPVNAPVVVELAIAIPKIPEPLLYVRGPKTESEVRDIFVDNTPDSTLTVPDRVSRLVLVVLRLPESEDTLVLVVFKFPERVVIFDVFVAMFPVAVVRLELVVAILPVMEAMVPLIAFCALMFVK
jgi:hypothetical protein